MTAFLAAPDASFPHSAPSVPGDTSLSTGSEGTGGCYLALCGPWQPSALCDLEIPRTRPWQGPGSDASEWGQLDREDQTGRTEAKPGDGSEEGLPPASPRLRCCLPLLASPGSAGSEADQTGKGLFLKTPYLGAEWNTVDPAGGARQRRRLHLPSLQHRGQRYPRHPAAGARCSVVGGQGNRAT